MSLKIRGLVRINAQGKKLYKFINLMHESRIECREQYCRGEVFRGDVFRKDMKKIRSLAEKCAVELKTAEYDSISARLHRFRNRAGLIIGLVLAAAAVLYFSRTVVTIEIEGNTSISDEVIRAALAELDVKAGTPLYRLDLRDCQNRLKTMVDGIAWAGMRHTGSRIVVQIREAVPKPDMALERVPCNIVASRDAVISSVLVQCGELKHIVGDYVPKGTLLISGVSDGDNGKSFIYHAMGDIRGTYEENISFSAPFVSKELLPTGKRKKLRRLRLFSLGIPLSFGHNDYEHSSSKKSRKSLELFGKKLPLGIDRTDITELSPTEYSFTEEELSQRLMERVYLYENNFLDKDTRILSREITPVKTDDTLTLNVKYQLEGSISVSKDIYIK
ncbi:sporulation protein YqfD [Ruminococcus flavefaciens]|uniref:Similar to stage IV sporulation protein n=1 Tax=Ruminococcus flavefaciens TaxID=1265 RepID=A0A1M7KVH8_RUMFL|nr:sporulation protein YqfD [Ruminococcus flavefaciens]SHM69542.1 similar to stage IV sporulation protein [Ruminococcus flavefaciens]